MPKPEIKAVPLIPPERLEKKTSDLKSMLDKDGLTEKDKEIASKLLKSYKSLKIASRRHFTENEYRDVIQTLFHSLVLLEENYFVLDQDSAQDYSRPISLFANKRDKILDAYLAGDYKGVIDHCVQLKTVFGEDGLMPEIALLFSLSLANEGMLEEAIDIAQGIARELEISPDLVLLRARIAEWQLKMGKRESALLVYERLTDTLDEQKAIIQSLSEKISETPTYPELEGTAGKFFQEVEDLVREHRFNEARDLLTLRRNEAQSGAEIKAIDQAMNTVQLTEERYLEEMLSRATRRKETLELARKLVEEEKFEVAVSKLDTLEAEQGYSRDIKELREQAVEGLINRERNRAAKFYLKAKKSADPGEKEKYLRVSYEILKDLIERYPSSPLNDKLNSHIERVEDELGNLGALDR
jgi:hypothetical protein